MSPFQEAALIDSHMGITNDLMAHLEPGGIVVSAEAFFILARPVRWGQPGLLNPWTRYTDPDTWFVWLLAGDACAALDALLPVVGPKKWLAFQTKGQPQRVRFSSLPSWLKAHQTRRQRLSNARA